MLTYRLWSLLIATAAVLFFTAVNTLACSCGGRPTVLGGYEGASVVAIMRLTAVEKSEDARAVDGVSSSKFEVIKVYKGEIRAGNELTFGQGGGGDCIWTFSERVIGEQFLFYLRAPQKVSDPWYVFGCGRSGHLDYAGDDLLFLDNLERTRGRSRLSGTVSFGRDEAMRKDGIKIRVTDGKTSFEAKTDRNGVYELYDLPAGTYFVQPEVIKGWSSSKVGAFLELFKPGTLSPPALPGIPVVIKDKDHTALDIQYGIVNAIRGRVLDPRGNPMQNVLVRAIDPDPIVEGDFNTDRTAEDGSFSIEGLRRGSYILVLNEAGRIDANQPFSTFYYPKAADRAKATVIYVGPGEFIDGINITVPAVEETITLRGLFLYSDSRPVVDERVEFKVETSLPNTDEGSNKGDSQVTTNEKGEFTLKILKGSRGHLFGSMFTYSGEFNNCPALEKLIRASPQEMPTIKTPVLNISADHDLFDLIVRFPFPQCEKDDDDDEDED